MDGWWRVVRKARRPAAVVLNNRLRLIATRISSALPLPSNVLPTLSSSDWCPLLPLFVQLERLSSYTLHLSATVLQGPHFSRHSSLSSSPGRTPYGQPLSPAAALRCTIM